MKLARPFLLVTFAAVLIMLVAACGQAASPTPEPTATATPSTGAAPEQAPPAEATPTPTPEPSFDAEAYFRGQTITLLVGFTPGGGYDTFARLVAQVAANHFPGQPRLVVRNIPGSGGELIFRSIEEAPADGLTTGTVHPRFIKRELLGIDVPAFDLEQNRIVGGPSASTETAAYYTKRDFATSWDDVLAKGRPITDGATAPGDTGGLGSTFIELLGGPVRMVYGYGGTAEIAAAFDRGELDGTSRGNYTTAPRLYPEWVEQQLIYPIYRWGADPEDDQTFVDYVTNDLNAEVPPHIFDLVDPMEGERAVFDVTQNVNNFMERMYILHPDTPDEVYQTWVEVFRATVEDPAFVEGAAVQGLVAGYAAPDDLVVQFTQGRDAIADDPSLQDLFTQLAGEE